VFIEDTGTGEFSLALAASILEKKVPLLVVTDEAKADFIIRAVSSERKAGQGEKVTRLLLGAGSGDNYRASLTISNRDGVVVFAHNIKKSNVQNAANSTANEIKKKGIQK
jgi:hypothetical protein